MYIHISNSSGKPIYEQILSQIKQAILTGELTAGDSLPSLRYLAKELKVSVISTKRAYEELEREGFIQSVPGKGSFVAPQNPDLIREEYLRRIETSLQEAIDTARTGGIPQAELLDIFTTLIQED